MDSTSSFNPRATTQRLRGRNVPFYQGRESHAIQRSVFFCVLCACVLLAAPTQAEAFELSGGVSVGGIKVGIYPNLAVSPFVGLLWRTESGFLLEAHNMFSIVPGPKVGVYDRTAAALGYAWKTGNFSLGPSLSVYSMLACDIVNCDRVLGAAPGVHAQTSWYFSGPLGASVSANVDWAGGSSRILPGGLVVMVTAGPVLRFQVDSK